MSGCPPTAEALLYDVTIKKIMRDNKIYRTWYIYTKKNIKEISELIKIY